MQWKYQWNDCSKVCLGASVRLNYKSYFWFLGNQVVALCEYKKKLFCICIMTRGGIYTVKYSLSTREIPRAEPVVFPKGSGYISPYILTGVIVQTFSISKSFTSIIVFYGRETLEEFIRNSSMLWVVLYALCHKTTENVKKKNTLHSLVQNCKNQL